MKESIKSIFSIGIEQKILNTIDSSYPIKTGIIYLTTIMLDDKNCFTEHKYISSETEECVSPENIYRELKQRAINLAVDTYLQGII